MPHKDYPSLLWPHTQEHTLYHHDILRSLWHAIGGNSNKNWPEASCALLYTYMHAQEWSHSYVYALTCGHDRAHMYARSRVAMMYERVNVYDRTFVYIHLWASSRLCLHTSTCCHDHAHARILLGGMNGHNRDFVCRHAWAWLCLCEKTRTGIIMTHTRDSFIALMCIYTFGYMTFVCRHKGASLPTRVRTCCPHGVYCPCVHAYVTMISLICTCARKHGRPFVRHTCKRDEGYVCVYVWAWLCIDECTHVGTVALMFSCTFFGDRTDANSRAGMITIVCAYTHGHDHT